MIPGRQCTPVDGRRGRAFTATTAPRTRSTAAARSLERDSSASIRLSSLAWHPRPACSRLVPAGIGRMARASGGRVAGTSQAEAPVIEGQPPLGRYRQVSSMLEEFRLAPRLGHCHDLQQVAVRVLEVETAPAPAGVDLAVGVAVWATAVGDPLGRHPGEDRLELRLADMERVVMALARPGVEARPAPQFWLVRKVKGQALVHLHLREVARARLDRQAEDLGEELGGGDLVFRWHDGMVQANRHCPPPDPVDPSPGDHSNCRSCDAWPGERFISQQKRPGRPPSLVVRLCHEREGRHANDNARVILRHHDEVWTKGTLSAVDELGGRDPLAGWENVDTQNVDTSGLEGRAKERDDLERLSEPWTDGAESSDQEQPADRRVIPGQEERPENEPGDSRMDGDPEPLKGYPRTALDDRKRRSRRRTPDGGEDDVLVQAAPKRAGQGKTEKNQRMRTGPFPRPRGCASARVMAVFCMGRVAAWHVHHPQHRRAVRLEKPHEEHAGKTKKDHVQARRVVQRDVRLDDHGRALTRHQSERLEDDAAPRQAAIISVRGESSGRSRLISDFETTAWTIADNPKPRTSAHRISQDIANAKLIAAPIAVAIPVIVTSFASERDRDAGGRRRSHHQPGVIRPAAHRG